MRLLISIFALTVCSIFSGKELFATRVPTPPELDSRLKIYALPLEEDGLGRNVVYSHDLSSAGVIKILFDGKYKFTFWSGDFFERKFSKQSFFLPNQIDGKKIETVSLVHVNGEWVLFSINESIESHFAIRWNQKIGFERIPELDSQLVARISSDGKVISTVPPIRYWKEGEGLFSIDDEGGEWLDYKKDYWSVNSLMNSDGSLVGGSIQLRDGTMFGVIQNTSTHQKTIIKHPKGKATQLRAMSSDGRVLVGVWTSSVGSNPGNTFVWTSDTGMRFFASNRDYHFESVDNLGEYAIAWWEFQEGPYVKRSYDLIHTKTGEAEPIFELLRASGSYYQRNPGPARLTPEGQCIFGQNVRPYRNVDKLFIYNLKAEEK